MKKVNISAENLSVFNELQSDSELLAGLCQDTMDYILDTTHSSDNSQCATALSCVKSMKTLIHLFEKLTPNENEN